MTMVIADLAEIDTASLDALRVALPQVMVEIARRIGDPADLRSALNDLYWSVLDVIEEEDGPQADEYAEPSELPSYTAIPEDLALKDRFLQWARGASLTSLSQYGTAMLAKAADRFANGTDRLAAFERYIGDPADDLLCAELGITGDERKDE